MTRTAAVRTARSIAEMRRRDTRRAPEARTVLSGCSIAVGSITAQPVASRAQDRNGATKRTLVLPCISFAPPAFPGLGPGARRGTVSSPSCHVLFLAAHGPISLRMIPARLTIATRESALALWQAHHIRERLLRLLSGPADRDSGHDHGRRSPARQLARQDRRQGPVRQGAGERAGGRARRHRGAFDEGRAHALAGRLHASPPSREREDPRDAFVSTRYGDLPSCPPAPRSARPACGARASSAPASRTSTCSRCAAT